METALTPSVAIAASSTVASSNKRLWTGRILTGWAALFLIFDGVTKLGKNSYVLEAMQRLGYPEDTARPIGWILLACLVVHLVPRTAVLGAVLLTGFLGGAIATHLRVEDPLFSHTLFPVYMAALIWGGLYLRDARVAATLDRTTR